MNDQRELKVCKKCGRLPVIISPFHVTCRWCGFRTGKWSLESRAIHSWNAQFGSKVSFPTVFVRECKDCGAFPVNVCRDGSMTLFKCGCKCISYAASADGNTAAADWNKNRAVDGSCGCDMCSRKKEVGVVLPVEGIRQCDLCLNYATTAVKLGAEANYTSGYFCAACFKTTFPPPPQERPPLGVMLRYLWIEKHKQADNDAVKARCEDLRRAIVEYASRYFTTPTTVNITPERMAEVAGLVAEWAEELKALTKNP